MRRLTDKQKVLQKYPAAVCIRCKHDMSEDNGTVYYHVYREKPNGHEYHLIMASAYSAVKAWEHAARVSFHKVIYA